MRLLLPLLLVACGSTPAPAPPASGPTASEALGWMVGTWRDEGSDMVTTERWAAAPDGSLVGQSYVRVGKVLGFAETLSVVPGDDGGFTYVAWPVGQDPVAFPLTEGRRGLAVFENPEHDFPQRITYTLGNDGRMNVSAVGVGATPDTPREERWSLAPTVD